MPENYLFGGGGDSMGRRRWWVLLGTAAVVGGGQAVWVHTRVRPAPPAFTDLHTALAPERVHGWELAVPPKRSGPYRLLPGGPVLGRNPATGLVGRLRDASGAVLEEIKLRGAEDRDQSIVYLETADGERTMAALVRVR
jgi:hypothetical protein